MSRADWQRVTQLAAREYHAEQAGTRAMAKLDWIAAAELEEKGARGQTGRTRRASGGAAGKISDERIVE